MPSNRRFFSSDFCHIQLDLLHVSLLKNGIMLKAGFLSLTAVISALCSIAQQGFEYTVELTPVSVAGLPGLHSFAFGQYEGKWLLIGGRKDGLHARQPFNAFPSSQNITDIYVVDVNAGQMWTASVNSLPVGLREQLQSTNMNYYQEDETLYIVGGYAFSTSLDDHVTFDKLTAVDVPGLIEAIVNSNDIAPFFKQISDPVFAVTGGQMGKIDNTFLLVGGHRFDGRYNPMGNPTYTQTYSNQIRRFSIDNSGDQLSFSDYEATTDAVHLHRRDYNLLPQIQSGAQTYAISSGVFQIGVDLPFLYPVEISADGYNPLTTFTQYLSNYHCAHISLFHNGTNENHTLFFGGMSRYYYQNGSMVQDDLVPFTKTISRLSRSDSGEWSEYLLPVEMPALRGASAEFILNATLPHFQSGVIKLGEIAQDTILLGHIVGGISSPTLNPFDVNQTNSTSASGEIFAVRLIKDFSGSIKIPGGGNPFEVTLFPNPEEDELTVSFDLEKNSSVYYYLTDTEGKIVAEGNFEGAEPGSNVYRLSLAHSPGSGVLIATFVFDDVFFVSKRVVRK